MGAAAFVWFASILLIILLPLLALIPYTVIFYKGADVATINAAMNSDPNVLLISLAGTFVSHLATLGVVWAVVTKLGKFPFWKTLGWSWSPLLGFWTSAVIAILLLAVGLPSAYFISQYTGGEKTPFEHMLESSTAGRFATAFLATATAPLVEELVYRGVLYSALQRAIGMLRAVVIVASLFTIVHVLQYYNNLGVIFVIGILAFTLTYVRARTRRLLPCFIIHLIFNGVQVASLIYTYFYPEQPDAPAQQGEAFALIGRACAYLSGLVF